MDFKDIIGQKEVVVGLIHSIENGRVGHAYLFCGPRGIGKRTVARIYASVLLCVSGDSSHSCGQCMPCRLCQEGTNPDYREVEAVGASIGVEEIRQLQSDLMVRPMYAPRKVYLILDADHMTVQAQNCLLKTLEEPPEYATILLTASNSEALLETIRSRTVRFNFRKYLPSEVRRCVVDQLGGSTENLDFIVSYADGIIGKGLELAASEEFAVLRSKTLDMLSALLEPELIKAFEFFKFFEENKEEVDTILDIMCLYYRDILLYKQTDGDCILINSDKKDMILISVPVFSTQRLVENIDAVEQARRNIKQNANFQLSIEVMLMRLQEE